MYIYMYGNKFTGCMARVEQAILCQCHIKEGEEKQKYSNLMEISLWFISIQCDKVIWLSLWACLDLSLPLFIPFHSLNKDEKRDPNRPEDCGACGGVEENQLVEVEAGGRLHRVLRQWQWKQKIFNHIYMIINTKTGGWVGIKSCGQFESGWRSVNWKSDARWNARIKLWNMWKNIKE